MLKPEKLNGKITLAVFVVSVCIVFGFSYFASNKFSSRHVCAAGENIIFCTTTTMSSRETIINSVIAKAKTAMWDPYHFGTGRGALGLPSWFSQSSPLPVSDCSAFVAWAYYWGSNGKVKMWATTAADFGRYGEGPSHDQNGNKYTRFSDSNQLLPGDLIYYYGKNGKPVHHVALYIGEGMMIHNGGADENARNCEHHWSTTDSEWTYCVNINHWDYRSPQKKFMRIEF